MSKWYLQQRSNDRRCNNVHHMWYGIESELIRITCFVYLLGATLEQDRNGSRTHANFKELEKWYLMKPNVTTRNSNFLSSSLYFFFSLSRYWYSSFIVAKFKLTFRWNSLISCNSQIWWQNFLGPFLSTHFVIAATVVDLFFFCSSSFSF